MPTKKRILICGASVAGPCLAYWLDERQFEITIVEKAKELRTGGQNIDIRGAGQQVIDRMGLTDAVHRAHTGELGLRFVDDSGAVAAEFPRSADTSFTSDMEILRGDLSRIFFDATKEKARYKFGTHVKSLADADPGVRVVFNDGTEGEFDLVVAADGMGSPTRSLILGEDFAYKYLGLYTSYFDIPRKAGDADWAHWYTAPGAKVAILRPGKQNALSASFCFLTEKTDYEHRDVNEQKRIVRRLIEGSGWECDRIAAGIERDEDFYLGPVSQVIAPRWSRGRCAVVGDAAYCPSPITGMGTTLAIVGAYVLAGELNANSDYENAFGRYERALRPWVTKTQKLPPGIPRVAYPRSRLGVNALNRLAGLVASRPVQKVIGALSSLRAGSGGDDFRLPDYK